jgi:hypothetical protein
MSNAPPELVIVVPYRDREANLQKLCAALRAHLAALSYRMVVVEQSGRELFNKGRLLNAGFDLYKDRDAYFCFHDVDMVPETAECDYSPPRCPTLVSKYCSQFGYRLPYPSFFGGVTLFAKAHFVKVNGFSNEFWGWGCEDDDMMNRIRWHRCDVEHRQGRYTSLPHEHHVDHQAWTKNVARRRLRYSYAGDGLRNVPYTVLGRTRERDYDHVVLDVGKPCSTATEDRVAREAAFRSLRRARAGASAAVLGGKLRGPT